MSIRGNNNIEARRHLVFDYLDSPEESRLPLIKFLRAHGMTRPRFFRFEGEYKAIKKTETKVVLREKRDKMRGVVDDAWDRIEGREPPRRIKGVVLAKISNDEKLALARKIYQDAMAFEASAKDKDLAVRMLGMLIEKVEQKVKLEFSAEDIAREHIEQQRWLRENGFLETPRVEQVQSEPVLLSEDIREDTR